MHDLLIILGYIYDLLTALPISHPKDQRLPASDLEVFKGLLVDPSFPGGLDSAGLAGEFVV